MDPNWTRQTQLLASVLQRVGECLKNPREAAEIHQVLRALDDSANPKAADPLGLLVMAGRQLELKLAATELKPRDAWTLVADGFPVVLEVQNDDWLILKHKTAWRLEAVSLRGETVESLQLTMQQLKSRWQGQSRLGALIAESTTAIPVPASQAHGAHTRGTAHAGHGHGAGGHSAHGHAHTPPLRRLWGLLRLEVRDIWTLTLFALVAGVLGLATPLAVESLVNTVAWGTYLQPLFVLSGLLFGFLAFAGLLKLLQQIIVEIIQRRMFVRIVGDLAHRFPMAKRSELASEHPSELANRYFDIMTIQKATASLILDGISIVLQTTIGLVLLAFYHPFLLGFDIILIVMMTVFTYVLGRGGIKSAIAESRTKYQLGHWLQDVISMPTAFRLHGGSGYAVDHSNRLVVQYLMGRQDHFRVLLRQSAFSLILLAVASTALLGVGGWLVMRGELTLGQLVASELVVTAVVGAFSKIGKSLESFYDLCAAVDKVGHMLDLQYDLPALDRLTDGAPPRIRWQNLPIHFEQHGAGSIITIEPGNRVAVTGPSGSGKSLLLNILAGLAEPLTGFAEVAGFDSRDASRVSDGHLISMARQPEIFNGTVLENVRLGRSWISSADVRRALEQVDLWEQVLALPQGIDSPLQTGGYPLTYEQTVRLSLARAIVSVPRVLLVDGILDLLDPNERYRLWDHLYRNEQISTILLATHDPKLVQLCNTALTCMPMSSHGNDHPATENTAHG